MKQDFKNYFVLIAFLPLAVFAFDIGLALCLTVGLILAAFLLIEDEQTLMHTLKPLTLAVIIGLLLAGVNLLSIIIGLFGINVGQFITVMSTIFSILRLLIFALLIIGTIFAIFSIKNQKDAPLLSKIIFGIRTGSCPFKQKTSRSKKNEPKPEDNEEEVEEIIIEE